VNPVHRIVVRSILLLLATGCGDDEREHEPAPPMTHAELLDPENCKDCHPRHYEEWSASMHAYATRDPVFVAMNKRMQKEAPEHKEFCVQCHAPMALREGAISDFADLSDVPRHLQGVTCYFCHNAVGVHMPYNNANIELANDTTMRGALGNPVADAAPHGVLQTKSKWHDSSRLESAQLCGTCHDIRTPLNADIERTFEEWTNSVSATPDPGSFNSCQVCHMKRKGHKDTAAYLGGRVPNRDVHSHLFPAVDSALTPDAPNQDALRAQIEKSELPACTLSTLMVEPGSSLAQEPFEFIVSIEQLAGHGFPSGASADRRVWIEATLYDDAGAVVYETRKVADGELETLPMDDPKYDPQFNPFHDRLLDANGDETHMFWEAADFKPNALPFSIDRDVPHTATRTFRTKQGLAKPPERIEIWLRLRPVGVDVLQDLVKSGHLDPAIVERMPTLTVAHRIFKRAASGAYDEELDLLGDALCDTAQTLSDLTDGM
jgi:Cytochrome c554 and c-prime